MVPLTAKSDAIDKMSCLLWFPKNENNSTFFWIIKSETFVQVKFVLNSNFLFLELDSFFQLYLFSSLVFILKLMDCCESQKCVCERGYKNNTDVSNNTSPIGMVMVLKTNKKGMSRNVCKKLKRVSF